LRGTGRRPFNRNLEPERDQERAREGEEVIGTQTGEDGRNRHIRATPILRDGEEEEVEGEEEGREGEEEEEEVEEGETSKGEKSKQKGKRPRVDDSVSPPKTRRKRRRPKCSENNLPQCS